MRIQSVNEVRWRLFEKKHKRENKIADLSSLPPCQEVLRYHCQRANYVAYIWRHSFQPMIQLEDVENHGWFQSGDIFWFNVAFPDDIKDMLCLDIEDDENDKECEEFYGSEVESEDSESRVKIVMMKLINN